MQEKVDKYVFGYENENEFKKLGNRLRDLVIS